MKIQSTTFIFGLSLVITSVSALKLASDYAPDVQQSRAHGAGAEKDKVPLPAHISSVPRPKKVKHTRPLESMLMKRAQLWSPEEIERLMRLREEGKSWGEIAQALPGRNWKSAKDKYYKMTKTKPAKDTPGRRGESRRKHQQKPRKKTKSKKWTAREDRELIKMKEENMKWKGIAERLPGRSTNAAKRRYFNLQSAQSEPFTVAKRYTAEEDELLRELMKTNMTWKERAERFPGRGVQSLKERYRLLDPSYAEQRNWTPEQDASLKRWLEAGVKQKEMARRLGRTYRAVVTRIRELRVKGQL